MLPLNFQGGDKTYKNNFMNYYEMLKFVSKYNILIKLFKTGISGCKKSTFYCH
jgi:hypothetical protein